MLDFSQTLSDKSDEILDQWIEAVQQDPSIQTINRLTFEAIRDNIPVLLKAMATTLAQSEREDSQALVEASLKHGVVRAEQGLEPAEIAREYRLLRQIIVSTLKKDLLQGSVDEILRAVQLIDGVIDEAIARCFESYTAQRLESLQQLQNQLALTNQELTRLVRDSKDSLSLLAHELKTPLNSIIGYSELFLRQQQRNLESGEALQKIDYIDRVLSNGRSLLALINNILEISRYEAGKMQLHPAPVALQTVMNAVVNVMEPLAQAKELQLVVDCERAPQEVITDALRLQQIVTNLVSNAIRYTETGLVEIRCESIPDSDQQWSLIVRDTGVGISPIDQARIFEPYFQSISEDQPQLPNSTGLGLAIVARLVDLLQGRLELRSQVGVGSTFTLIFPLIVKARDED